ncbi:MAG: hypothetical protein WCI88_06510, partial [Chloroflexota bacterium]
AFLHLLFEEAILVMQLVLNHAGLELISNLQNYLDGVERFGEKVNSPTREGSLLRFRVGSSGHYQDG